jgi:anti-sigma factor RsiW
MMRRWRRRNRALVCRDAVALMTAYLDGQLDERDRDRLEAHLADCPHCSEYLAQLRLTIDALGHVDVDELPDQTVDDLLQLYRQWQRRS